jgi:hypothetical protein
VCADAPPTPPADRYVDVRPGAGATFDGSRWHGGVTVRRPDDGRLARADLSTAGDTALRPLAESNCRWVRLGDRARLRGLLAGGAAAALEGRLVGETRAAGGTLLAWTRADPDPRDGDRYDRVFESPP